MKSVRGNNNITEYDNKTDLLDELSEIYESLSPSSEITNGQAYFNALDWALEQDDIHNIAITGPYGSGKSSVINSYFKRHTDKKFVNISLAAFAINSKSSNDDSNSDDDSESNGDSSSNGEKNSNEKNNGNSNDNNKESLEQQLESGILKHLLYSVDATKIPKSR